MVWAPEKGRNGWGIQGVTCRNWEQPCPGWQRRLPGKGAGQRQEGGAPGAGQGWRLMICKTGTGTGGHRVGRGPPRPAPVGG